MAHRPGALVSELNFHIHESLTGRGIELPFPRATSTCGRRPLVGGMEPAHAANRRWP